MKLQNKSVETVQTPDDDVFYMEIDERGKQILMENLTNMYRNAIEAVSRETISNALDTHARVGQTRPIEVRFPYQGSLSVKDFGSGLDRKGIAKSFGSYGASDKQQNNKERGGFGLGAKSGLAITDRFAVISYKDGVKTVAEVSRKKGEPGRVTIVSETPAEADNGTQVIIPITSEHTEWLRKNLHGKLLGYHRDQFLINDEHLRESIHDSTWFPLTNGVETYGHVRPSEDRKGPHGGINQRLILSAGGVLYPLDEAPTEWFVDVLKASGARGLLNSAKRVVLNAPIGSAELTPARDSLIYSAKTAHTIVTLLKQYKTLISPSFSQFLQTLPREKAFQYALNNVGFLTETEQAKVRFTPDGFNTIPVLQELQHNNQVIRLAGLPNPADGEDFYFYKVRDKRKNDGWEKATKWTSETVPLAGRPKLLVPSPYFQQRTGIDQSYLVSLEDAYESIPPVILTVPDFTDEVQAQLGKNLKDFGKSLFGKPTFSAYIFKSGVRISDELDYLVGGHVYSYESMLSIAKEFRSEARKAAAAKANPARPVSYITYTTGAPIPDRPHVCYYLSLDEKSRLPQNIIYYAEEEAVNGAVGAYHIYADWRNIPSAKTITHELQDEMNGLFPAGTKIVFIPAGRSLAAFKKAFPTAESYQSHILTYVKAHIAQQDRKGLDAIANITSLYAEHVTYVERLQTTVKLAELALQRKLDIPDRTLILSSYASEDHKVAKLIARYYKTIQGLNVEKEGVTFADKYAILLGNSNYFYVEGHTMDSAQLKRFQEIGGMDYVKAERIEKMINTLHKGTLA